MQMTLFCNKERMCVKKLKVFFLFLVYFNGLTIIFILYIILLDTELIIRRGGFRLV